MYTSSPSHHRELSHAEKHRVQSIVDAVETTILDCTPSDRSTSSGNCAAVLPQQLTELPLRLGELLGVVQSDESVCGGLVKTTRTVPILRRLLDLHLEYVVAADNGTTAENSSSSAAAYTGSRNAAADAIYCALPVAARILLVLVVNSHSRRAFSGILPTHAAGFLQLLRHADTLPDCCRMLCHVFLYTQDAKDILDQLVDKAGFLQVLQRVCRDAVVRSAAHSAARAPGSNAPLFEVSLMTAIFSLMSAVVSVTPQPDARVLDAVQAMVQTAMLPLLLEREAVWASDLAAMSAQQQTTLSEVSERISTLHGEVLQVLSVLALEGFPASSATSPDPIPELLRCWERSAQCSPREEMVSFWRSCCSVGASVTTAPTTAAAGNHQHPADDVMMTMVVRRMREHLSTIRRHNLDTKAVQTALSRMHEDVGGAVAASTGGVSGSAAAARAIAETCSFVVGHLPGGMKTLCGTLSTVDEGVSSLSCAVLVTLLRGGSSSYLPSPPPTAATEWSSSNCDRSLAEPSDHSRHPMHQFVALDGVLLLADMLDDYSDDVLAGAVGLLAAASGSPRAVREMISHHVLRKVRTLMTTIAERMWSGSGGCDGGGVVDDAVHLTSSLVDGASSSSTSSTPAPQLTPLAALCCDLVTQLPDDGLLALSAAQQQHHLTSVMCLWWRFLDRRILMDRQQHQQSGGSFHQNGCCVDVFPLLNPFLRMCCRVASLHGEAVRASISLYHHCTNAADATTSPNIPWMSVWVQSALERGGVDAGIAVASSVTHFVIPHLLAFDASPQAAAATPTRACGDEVVAVVCDVARGVFCIPVDCVVKQRRLYALFWSVVADLLDRCVLLSQKPLEEVSPETRAVGDYIVHMCRANLWEPLIGSLQAISNAGDISAGGVGDALVSIVRVLGCFRMLQRDDIANAVASVAARGDCTLEDRVAATRILVHHILLRSRLMVHREGGRGADPSPTEGLPSAAVTTTLSIEVKDSLALLWTRIILLCEEGDDGDDPNNGSDGFAETSAASLANECFAELVDGAERYVGVLVRTGLLVLDFMMSSSTGGVPLGWLGYASDTDDAHDILVALVPLINGLLSQCPACRWSVVRGDVDNDDNGMLIFFLRLLSSGPHLEVPLKVLGMYGLWHCLDLSLCAEQVERRGIEGGGDGRPDEGSNNTNPTPRPPSSGLVVHCETVLALRLRQFQLFPILAHVLREAHDVSVSHQPDDALAQIRLGCYLLAERVALLSPSPTAPGAMPWMDVWQFVEQTIFALGGESEPQACSMLLCVLQDDQTRQYFRTNSEALYRRALQRLWDALQRELSGVVDGGGSAPAAALEGGAPPHQFVPPPPPPSASSTSGGGGGGAYYAFLQVQKYYAELQGSS